MGNSLYTTFLNDSKRTHFRAFLYIRLRYCSVSLICLANRHVYSLARRGGGGALSKMRKNSIFGVENDFKIDNFGYIDGES